MTAPEGLEAEIQKATSATDLPSPELIQQWFKIAFPELNDKLVLIRFVDESESAELNQDYRNKTGPTNILSFPLELPQGVPNPQLGDLIICTSVTAREADEQQKPLLDHYCHLLIHGVLHLQGYDHLNEEDAAEMEALEIQLLNRLGIADPY